MKSFFLFFLLQNIKKGKAQEKEIKLKIKLITLKHESAVRNIIKIRLQNFLGEVSTTYK
jgi:hypothetical protein